MAEKVETSGIEPWILLTRLAIARAPWLSIVAGLVGMAGLLAWCWLVPLLRADLEARRKTLHQANQALMLAQSAPVSRDGSSAQSRLSEFRAFLGEDNYKEQQVATLLAIARKNELVLNAADYRSGHDRDGGFYTYQMVMPVKGSYVGIRRFCEQALLAMPFASLDEISFRRENIASTVVDAKLRITLFLARTANMARDGS